MVTKLDLVERQLQHLREPRTHCAMTARELMMPLVLTLNDRATVAHAAAMMATEQVHHVSIVNGAGCLIGIVSTLDVTCWLAANDGFTLPVAPAP